MDLENRVFRVPGHSLVTLISRYTGPRTDGVWNRGCPNHPVDTVKRFTSRSCRETAPFRYLGVDWPHHDCAWVRRREYRQTTVQEPSGGKMDQKWTLQSTSK